MKNKSVHEPGYLDLSKDSDWEVYEWPEDDGSVSIKLEVEIINGQLFPAPLGGMSASYVVPGHAMAWGWNSGSSGWKQLYRFGEFSKEFTYITFTLLHEAMAATAGIVLFCPIPLSEEEIAGSFPPYVKPTDHESVIPELAGHNPPEKIDIKDCKTVRELSIHGCGDATVIVEIGNPITPVLGLIVMLGEAALCALKLAEFRAQRRLSRQEELIVQNTTCPEACNMPILVKMDVTPFFYASYDIKIDDDKKMYFYVTMSGRLVEKIKIKCKKV